MDYFHLIVITTAWDKVFLIQNINLWSIITFIDAALIMPLLLEQSNGNIFQFLDFLSQYLIYVSLTPKWENNEKIHTWYLIFAYVCAACAFLFILFALCKWWCLLISLIILLTSALLSKTLKLSLTFWSKMVMFLGIYLSLII